MDGGLKVTGDFSIDADSFVRYMPIPVRGSGHREVRSETVHSQSEFDDFAVLLTFASGTIGTFVIRSCGMELSFSERLEIYGKYSTTTVEDMERVITRAEAGDGGRRF